MTGRSWPTAVRRLPMTIDRSPSLCRHRACKSWYGMHYRRTSAQNEHGPTTLWRHSSLYAGQSPRAGRWPGTPVETLLVAGHRRLRQGGGGAPGRRLHSRRHGSSRAWIVLTRLTFVGRGGTPRAWAGERGCRRRPGAQALVGWACTGSRDSLDNDLASRAEIECSRKKGHTFKPAGDSSRPPAPSSWRRWAAPGRRSRSRGCAPCSRLRCPRRCR